MNKNYSSADRDLLAKIGEKIRKYRSQKGYSQESFAFECDLDRTYYSSVERGERNISVLNLYKIAKTLGIKVGKILE